MSRGMYREGISINICQNHQCGRVLRKEDIDRSIFEHGVIFADCGEEVWQGYSCPHCLWTNGMFVPRDSPNFDMSNLILFQSRSYSIDQIEQIFIDEKYGKNDILRFKTLPTWDETVEAIDVQDEFPETYNLYRNHKEIIFSVYCLETSLLFMTKQDVLKSIQNENTDRKIRLRRLYPDTKYNRLLISVLSAGIMTSRYKNGAFQGLRTVEPTDNVWDDLLTEALGIEPWLYVDNYLKSKIGLSRNLDEIKNMLQQQYYRLYIDLIDENPPMAQIDNIRQQIGSEKIVLCELKSIAEKFCGRIISSIAYSSQREALSKWVDNIEKGNALFINAPMGLGKTYAIATALADNPQLSAIVFMPTKRMCLEIVNEIKGRITLRKKINWLDKIVPEGVYRIDENGLPILISRDGIQPHYKETFLSEEVFYHDGINAEDCIHCKEISDEYQLNIFNRKAICSTCERRDDCRYMRHLENARKSRIVVATHVQHTNMVENSQYHEWEPPGAKKEQYKKRDLFIIDEDLLFQNFIKPYSLTNYQYNEFIKTIRKMLFADKYDDYYLKNVNELNARISVLQKPGIYFVPSVNKEFKFKEKFNKNFNDEVIKNRQKRYKLEKEERIGDWLSFIEDAIKIGCVVTCSKNSKDIYFPKTKVMKLKDAPPHVFFDATGLPDKYLKIKIPDINIKHTTIEVEPAFDSVVYQNINSDLTKTKINIELENVKQFVFDILGYHGKYKKYFIATKKEILKSYLHEFIEQFQAEYSIAVENFGNLRGLNTAEHCEVGIMLGSYLLPDSFEIAVSLSLDPEIFNFFEVNNVSGTLWDWDKTNNRRKYKSEYQQIEDIANILRCSEQKQALGRIRHLHHSTIFYVISKDLVSDYEPSLTIAYTNYRADLFPQKFYSRPQSYFEFVKNTAVDLLKKQDFIKVGDIAPLLPNLSKKTIQTHLNRMVNLNLLYKDMPGGRKYFRTPPSLRS